MKCTAWLLSKPLHIACLLHFLPSTGQVNHSEICKQSSTSILTISSMPCRVVTSVCCRMSGGRGVLVDSACITMRDYVLHCAGLHIWYARVTVGSQVLSLKVHLHYKPDSIPIQSGSIETGSKLDSIHIDCVHTIVGSSAELLWVPYPTHASGKADMQYRSDEGTQALAVSTRRRNVSSSGRYCPRQGWHR